MYLQPYGPIEEAIQKSIAPETTPSNSQHFFWGGVLATLLTGIVVYSYFEKQKNQKAEEEKP